jgi:hypothetical protein
VFVQARETAHEFQSCSLLKCSEDGDLEHLAEAVGERGFGRPSVERSQFLQPSGDDSLINRSEVIPGDTGAGRYGDQPFGAHLFFDGRQEMGVNALVSGSGVGDLLFEGAVVCDDVRLEDSGESLTSDGCAY